MRQDFIEWLNDTKRRHLKALVKHPHHYAVAGGLTLFLLALGAYESSAIYAAWAYAVLENLAAAD